MVEDACRKIVPVFGLPDVPCARLARRHVQRAKTPEGLDAYSAS